jgi:hypothetical protein
VLYRITILTEISLTDDDDFIYLCKMLRYFLIGMAIYIGYRFLFEFLLPMIKTTRQVKKQFDAVREQQEEILRQQTNQRQQKQPGKSASRSDDDDYIEFEEIK